MSHSPDSLEGIAIVGMAGRFPGARNVAEFWNNLLAGKETLTTLGARSSESGRTYVPRRGLLDRPEYFDAAFFGISPREAEVIDPQQRAFLEEAWTALEDANCDPTRYSGAIGVFAGMTNNTYWANNVAHHPELIASTGWLTAMMGNEKDYLATRTAYKLNLRGPAISINTACSTSLVAVCQAVQSLLSYGCDMALAGGMSITFPHERGYFYEEGGITSPDGYCRPFDINASGTVFSNGGGVVALKRLADAVADGDRIYAVIKGAAPNNDGSNKVSFTAPSVDGHAEVIALAHALAGFEPRSIGYVEAHGTATPLGDPIEIAGLTKAFRAGTDERGFCAIGSVKSNIGHLDAAAGVAGLIKAALVLHHGRIPASLHFNNPNPALLLDESPFAVAATARDWPAGSEPRRAGVSSFGVGGTNAHCVLEEFANPAPSAPDETPQVLVLSARTETALAAAAENLAKTLEESPSLSLGDVARTLQTGRRAFAHRMAVAASHSAAAINALRGNERRAVATGRAASGKPRVVFMFPGQGAQYAGMGVRLAEYEPVFRDALAKCADVLRAHLDVGLLELLSDSSDAGRARLRETRYTQPAIFSVSFALSELLRSWGIVPDLMIGHSVGEYVAATIAGVFTLDDALSLVAERARLVQAQPHGAMLAVRASAAELEPRLPADASIAAINGPSLSVVAGPLEIIAAVEKDLAAAGFAARRLETSHAFHSAMMEPVVAPLIAAAARVSRNAPQVPILSTVTATWMTAEDATSPEYWARHARETVRFSPAVAQLVAEEDAVFIECGPGNTLTQLGRQHAKAGRIFASALRDGLDEITSVHTAIGQLWAGGIEPDWIAIDHQRARLKVSLPTYPFERQRFFADAPETIESAPVAADVTIEASVDRASESGASTDDVLGELLGELHKLSGLDLTGASPELSFTELGFDSLFLTQAAIAINARFGVKVTFRQLLQELHSPAAVAEYIKANRSAKPGKVAPSSAPLRTAIPAAAPSPRAHGPFRGIDRTSTTLTPEQEAHVSDLLARYIAKTAASKAYTAKHRSHLADPRAVAGFRREWKESVYPLICDRSEGSKLWDADGNEYTDITLGFGQILFGHRPSWLVDALKRQLDSGIEIGPTSSLADVLAERLGRYLGLERVAFCNTGSEAVAAALRVSRTVTGRDRVVVFGGAYHGIFDEVLFRPGPAPIAPGIPQSAVQNLVVLDYGSDDALAWLRANCSDVAAILIESVQSRNPGLAPREFLHELRNIATENGAALIFDEIVTGFRVAPGGAQEYFGVKADIATYGKIIGGGIPSGIVGGKREYLDALDGGDWKYGDDSFPEIGVTFFAGTFVRHPLALAAASVVLDELEKRGPELQRSLAGKAGALTARMNATLDSFGIGLRWQTFSSFYYLAIPAALRYAPLIFTHMRLRGIHVWENRPCFLCAEHTDADLDKNATAFEDSVRVMAAAGLLGPVTLPGSLETAPLSDAQQEIFLAAQLGGDASAAFNDTVRLRIHGEIDGGRLKAALAVVMERHPSLRSTFSMDGKLQRFHPAGPVEIGRLAAPDEDAVRHAFIAQSEAPFDLQQGPLWRATLVSRSATAHEFLFTAHHIACDGWSFSVVAAELAAIYSGRTPLTEPLSIAKYNSTKIAEQRSDSFLASEAWWLRKFASIPAPLDLPTDAPRSTQRTFRASTRSAILPAEVCEPLRKVAAAHRSTLYAALFTGFAALLSRLSGQRELVVGIASAGQAETESPLVGHCVNFLPLPVLLDESGTLASTLPILNSLILDAQEHQQVTFGRLLQKLVPPRIPGRIPLVSVSFNVDRAPGALLFDEATAVYVPAEKSRYHLELSFNLIEEAGGYRVFCNFNRDLFSAATIERWLGHYVLLLSALAEKPDAPLDCAPLLSSGERAVIVEQWNRTARDYPRDRGLDALFEEQAAARPDAVAVQDGGRTFTYAQIDSYANALAARLAATGLPAGSFIGVALERSAGLIVATLGIIKAGFAYAPIDPSWPAERVAFMVEDLGLRVVVAPGPLPGMSSAQTIGVDLQVPGGSTKPPVETNGNSVAYVIYTSGSTGKPKGVVVPHRAVSRLVLITDYAQLTADDCVGHASNPAFDAATFEIWGTLLNGARIVVLAKETMLDPARLAVAIREQGITAMFITTALFNQIAALAPETFKPLRHLLFGGDAASPQAVGRVFEQGEPERLCNIYGPTEVTTFSTFHRITAHPRGAAVPIGRPIANTTAYILDGRMQPVPVGVAGELMLGGDGLAIGYHGRHELTSEKFVSHPFEPGGRLYRTGDRAKFRPDGAIEFLGRLDGQIKLRGFRVEPGEIEATLAKHPGVREVAVKVCGADAGGKSLAAYFVANAPAPDAAMLREFVASQLPDYMVPSSFIALERLPMNANGKVDRAALPEPAISGATSGSVGCTPTASRIASVMASVLRRGDIPADGDFFRLGGHSLLAMDLLARIKTEFGVAIPASVIFEHATPAALGRYVDERRILQPSADTRFIVPIQRGAPGVRPLFLVAGGWGGEIEFLVYGQLGRHIGERQPIYGLKARGAGTGEAPHTSVTEMAADYIREIRAIQPHGPYLIAGECVGGICAHEIACQLRDAGEDVGMMLLLDTSTPNLAELEDYLRAEEQKRAAESRPPGLAQRVRMMLGAAARRILGRTPPSAPVQHPRGQAEYPVTLMRHTLRPYRGRISMLVDAEAFGSHGKLGWDKIEGVELDIHVLPGTHITYIRDNNEAAAAKLRELLEKSG